MRLYSRTGAGTVQNDDYGSYDTDPDTGLVEVPDEFGHILHRQHIDGQRAWENDAERAGRLKAEDVARRSDPAALYDLVDARLGKLEANDLTALYDLIGSAIAKAQPDAPAGAHEAPEQPAKPPAKPRKATA